MSDLQNSVSGVVPDDNAYQRHTKAPLARYDVQKTDHNDANQEGIPKLPTKPGCELPSEQQYAQSKDYDTLLQENGALRK